jgi:hypothetical protein
LFSLEGSAVDIVLPLLEADLDRYLRLQRPTFERFYGDLHTTRVIVRETERSRIERAVASLDRVVVIGERELVPELALTRLTRKRVWGPWYRQQLIKLAAVRESGTPFALVLDADVIAVRPVSDGDLVHDNRALRSKDPASIHPQWIDQAGRALGMPALDYTAAVTPSVLSRDAVAELAEYAHASLRPHHRALRVAEFVPGTRRHLTTWRGRLLSVLPWTEYQLYDTYLVGCGRFEQYHEYSADPVLSANGVWSTDDFDAWDPHDPPGDTRVHYFSVIQGYLGIDVRRIEAKLAAHGLLSRAADT